jgi:FkbM family methyltransferase
MPGLDHRPTEDFLRGEHPGAWDEFVNVHKWQREDFAGRQVLDLGAHVGFASLLALAWDATRVISVEPDPSNFLRLRGNLAPYPRATALNCACGRPGRVALVDKDSNSKTIHADDDPAAIPSRTLRDLAGLLDPAGDAALKVDVEGAEAEALLWADAATLRRFSTIMLETHQTPHLPPHEARRAKFLLDYVGFMGFREMNSEPLCWWTPEGKCEQVGDMVATRMAREDRP